MEQALANIISALLARLLSEPLKGDIENFVSNVQNSVEALEKVWRNLMQIQSSRASDSQSQCYMLSCNNGESCGGEVGRLSGSDVKLVLSRLGIDGGGETGFGAGDLESLFEAEEPSLEEIRETFGVLDVNNDGYIDAGELQRVVCELGLSCEAEECERMIRRFDSNGDGLIDFLKLMEKCLCG